MFGRMKQVLKTGLGTDASGRIDIYEFMQAVEDMAAQQDWSVSVDLHVTRIHQYSNRWFKKRIV